MLNRRMGKQRKSYRGDGRPRTRRGKLHLAGQPASVPSLARVPAMGKRARTPMMSRILVVDQERRPLMPTTPARARILLKGGKAAILRRFPLVLLLKEARPEAVVEPLHVKLDPGSKTSGIAVVNDQTAEVVWAAELTHRSSQVHE